MTGQPNPMCGGCSGPTQDWAGPFISGPIRRAAVARFLTPICRHVAVTTFARGWSITRSTGASIVAKTFDDLLDAVVPFCIPSSWLELENSMAGLSEGRPDEFGAYRGPHIEQHKPVSLVLVASQHVALPVRLTAFCLGVRAFESGAVGIDVNDRAAPFRLLADKGNVLGAVHLHTTATP